MATIAVFCASKDGVRPADRAAAADFARAVATAGHIIAYGGSRVGLMGLVATEALAAGGAVVGVMPQQMLDWEPVHTGLTRLETTPTVAARKARLIAMADAVVALPGGFGTLDELFEVVAGIQMRLWTLPVGLLNPDGYWDALLAFCDTAVERGFLDAGSRDLLTVASTPKDLLSRLDLAGTLVL